MHGAPISDNCRNSYNDDLSDDDKMSFVEDALKRSAVRCFYRISLCDTVPPHQMYAFRSTLGCGWSFVIKNL